MNKFYQTTFYQALSCFSTTFKTIKRNLQGIKMEGEVAVLPKFIAAGSVCLDIGGAYGRYALPMSRVVGPSGKIYSFEPGRYSFRVLTAIIKFHGLKNVVAVKKALSDREGTIKLFSPLKKGGKIGPSLSYIGEVRPEQVLSEDVEMTTMDRYCARNNIVKIDFIKCDTEGAEFSIFQGGKDMIEKNRPVILSEIDRGNLSRYRQTVEQVQEFFAGLKYKAYIYRNNTFIPAASLNEATNYFFIPEEKTARIN